MAFSTLKRVLTLRKYVDGVPTDEIKENLIENSDYIAPYQDYVDCPIGSTDPTPTPTPTLTPTNTPTPTPDEVFVFNYSISTCDGSNPNYIAFNSLSEFNPGESLKMPDGKCYFVIQEISFSAPYRYDGLKYDDCFLCEQSIQ